MEMEMEILKNFSTISLALFLFTSSALFSLTSGEIQRHQFVIQATPVKRLCKTHNSITVNGMFPGPTLEVRNGDSLQVQVVNKARYNVTIHWRLTMTCLNFSSSFIDTTIVTVDSGETNLLRVINAALNQPLFFAVANHKLTVVGADASYTKPFTTSVLMLGPGQTTDVLIKADQSPARYYMAARAYQSFQNAPFDNTTTTAILEYKSAEKGNALNPIMPSLPAYNDTNTVTAFTRSFRSPRKVQVPTNIDESLFFTIGLGLNNCPPNFNKSSCQGPNGTRFTASMNNVSFVLPRNFSLLQAHQQGIPGVFTTDFPGSPPVKFDYTGNVSRSLYQPITGTKLYKLKFGSRVQVVIQDTSIVGPESHPIHLHGYDFYIIAEGFGNFDPKKDTSKFNLVDPPLRNTVSVPSNGWAVIRFVAENPGVWLMHCHLDVHINWGLAMSFLVENGVGELQSLPPPPPDLPVC
ncbi:hypothetical protein V6N13_142792 [Hibiscus sabdariffa]